MNKVTQTALGSNNRQTSLTINRALDPVDICADKIGSVLKSISSLDLSQPRAPQLIPPDITQKNIRNKVDEANSIEIESTYSLWDEINENIRSDSSGLCIDNYHKSAHVLNQLYLSKYQERFPEFKIHVITMYCQINDQNLDDVFVLTHLIHFMYLSCQIGIKP